MSGHSKWAGIKHKKAANDAKRGNLFTKLANNITVAAKQGGGKVEFNPSLRIAVEAARGANMPKDNIERAIKRGTGELGGAAVEELLFEAFGPGNVAMLVEALTDNRNRTNADVRTIINKTGGRIADSGVAYQFDRKGVIRLLLNRQNLGLLEDAIIESGADDYRIVELDDKDIECVVYTEIGDLHQVKDALESLIQANTTLASSLKIESTKIEWVAKNPVEVEDPVLEKVAHLQEVLDENDDVTNVYTNVAE